MKTHTHNNRRNIAGKRIKEARKRKKLSQSQLAAKMQVAGTTIEDKMISCIEIGNRTITDYELPVFAKVLGVSVYWLLGLTDNPNE